VSTGALFLLVGFIYERRHTREISKLRGLQKPAPMLAAVFTVVMLSSIGLPGLNGFVGEFLILMGSFLTRRWWAVVAVSGVILAALYLLWAYQRVFHGEPDEDNASIPDLRLSEGLVMAPLLVLIVVMGVYPKPFIERIEPAVARLVTHVEDNSDYVEPRVATEGEKIVPESEMRADEHGTDEHAEATSGAGDDAGDDAGHGEDADHEGGE
jgi:NADH-quinone oxidoreductase subunit M